MMHSYRMMNIFIIGFSLFATCWANNNLQSKYEWKTIDFNYETAAARQEAIDSKVFIPDNVIPVGLDVHENRLFLSLPRLKHGVPASLAFINMEELTESNAPAVKPYPSWQAHRTVNANDSPDIVSPFHIKVDRCNRLWALDTGIEGILNKNDSKRLAPARILIYDLRTDNLIRKYTLPSLTLDNSVFSNIAVDDNDCEKSFAYIADASTPPSLTVYSYESNESWQVKHNFFNIDPLAGNFSILGVNYRTNDALYGLALTEKKANGYPDLYFHALTSTSEFNVSTAILQNKSISEGGSAFYKDFTVVGSRNTNEQAGASVYDPIRKVIFYTLPNMNEIACWKTTNKNYSVSNVFSSPVKMVYPIDIKIDSKERIWVLSNNMQHFLNDQLSTANEKNFYVHFIPIKEAIKNTPCEPGFIEHVVNKFNKALQNDDSGSVTTKPAAIMTFIASILISAKHLF